MWVEEDDDCVCDFNSLSAIALPSSSDGVEMPLTTTAKYSNDTQTSVSTVLATDPSGFSRPVDAGLRFRHLLKDYNLCRGGQAHSTILPPTSTAPSKTPHPPAVDVEEGRMQSELFAEDEPRWMVWSYCEVCM